MDDLCPACKEPLVNLNYATLPCNHDMCVDCILLWGKWSSNICIEGKEFDIKPFSCAICRYNVQRPFYLRNKKVIPLYLLLQSSKAARVIMFCISFAHMFINALMVLLCVLSIVYLTYQFLCILSICFVPTTVINSGEKFADVFCFPPFTFYGYEISLSRYFTNRNEDDIRLVLDKYFYICCMMCFIIITAFGCSMFWFKLFERFNVTKNMHNGLDYVMQKKFFIYY